MAQTDSTMSKNFLHQSILECNNENSRFLIASAFSILATSCAVISTPLSAPVLPLAANITCFLIRSFNIVAREQCAVHVFKNPTLVRLQSARSTNTLTIATAIPSTAYVAYKAAKSEHDLQSLTVNPLPTASVILAAGAVVTAGFACRRRARLNALIRRLKNATAAPLSAAS